MDNIFHCERCDIIVPEPTLCEECYYTFFEELTGIKPTWVFNEKKQEWEQYYIGLNWKNMGEKT